MTLSPDTIPIAKVFSPHELHGWLKKSVTIPMGKTGLVLYRGGRQRLLPAGKHLVLNPFTRLRGDGIGMLAGFCGTLMTPMAANFNVVPANLLELPDRNSPLNGVIRAQIPTALPLLLANIGLMYVLAFPR